MPQFHNRIRLPFYFGRPQFPTTRSIYRKADGSTIVQSAVVRKVYEGNTDYLSERLHERIKIMLEHDFLQFEGQNYYGRVAATGDYQINWLPFRDMPIAMSKFQVEVTPFDATNSNCADCSTIGQVVANDDTYLPDIEEDTDYDIDVKDNDNICCSPAVFSLISFNTAYLISASIDADTGLFAFHTGTGLVADNNVKLGTYRVTCPNGGYDEADIFAAHVNGTVVGCLSPTALSMFENSTVTATISFTPPATLPDHYHWFLYDNDAHVIVQDGDEPVGGTAVEVVGLTPGTDYIFYIRSQCDATDDDATASGYVNIEFTTPPVSALCGTYVLTLDDPTQPDSAHGGHLNVNYVDCNGNNQTLYLPNHNSRTICAMQTAPGSPTSINTGGNPYVTINYTGICGNPRPTLTFGFVHGGDFLQFTATLSFAIDGVVNITKVFADGFDTGDCSSGAVASAEKNSLMSIPSGLTGVSAPPESISGDWTPVTNYTIYNVIVNSTPLVDGATIIIGSYTVDIVMPFCII